MRWNALIDVDNILKTHSEMKREENFGEYKVLPI